MTKGNILDTCNYVTKVVFDNTVYAYDTKLYNVADYWGDDSALVTMRMEHMLKKHNVQRIQQDCENTAMTISSLLITYGVPKDHIYIAYCLVPVVDNKEKVKWFGHAVCLVQVGTEFMVCEQLAKPRTLKTVVETYGYKFIAAHREDFGEFKWYYFREGIIDNLVKKQLT